MSNNTITVHWFGFFSFGFHISCVCEIIRVEKLGSKFTLIGTGPMHAWCYWKALMSRNKRKEFDLWGFRCCSDEQQQCEWVVGIVGIVMFTLHSTAHHSAWIKFEPEKTLLFPKIAAITFLMTPHTTNVHKKSACFEYSDNLPLATQPPTNLLKIFLVSRDLSRYIIKKNPPDRNMPLLPISVGCFSNSGSLLALLQS